ncbi:unnamed protein product, partial [Nesidiocoris tenuis]
MDGAHESFTVLPPLSPRVPAVPPPPPTPADSRVAPRTVAHKEATAFVILGEIAIPTADDKKGPPAGRVSPFRGSGFRAPSPPSPTSKIPVLNGKSAPASPARNINNKTNNNTVNNGKISTKNKLKTQIQGKSAPTSPKKITATTRRKIDSPSRVPVSIKSQSNVDLPTLKDPNNNKRLTTKTLPRTPRRAPQNGTTKAPAPVQRRLAPDGKPAPAVRSRLNNGPVSTEVKAGSVVGPKNAAPKAAVRRTLTKTENVATLMRNKIHPVSPRAPPKSFNRPRGNFRDRFRDAICGCCGRGRLQSGKIGILGADNDRVNVITDSGKKREAESEEPPQKWYSRLCRRKKKEAQPPRLAKPMKPQGKSFLSKMNCCKKGPTIRKPQMVQNGPSIWRKIFCLDAALCAKCCMKKRAPAAPPPGASRLEMKRSSSVPAPPKPTGLPKLDLALVEHGSVMKGAIPVLPICLAWMCLILNILIPGTGTIISGFLCMCFGKPRFSVNDSAVARLGSLCVNMIVGISQIFTIIFCLVGWGWSIWWGVIMIKVA